MAIHRNVSAFCFISLVVCCLRISLCSIFNRIINGIYMHVHARYTRSKGFGDYCSIFKKLCIILGSSGMYVMPFLPLDSTAIMTVLIMRDWKGTGSRAKRVLLTMVRSDIKLFGCVPTQFALNLLLLASCSEGFDPFISSTPLTSPFLSPFPARLVAITLLSLFTLCVAI